MANETDLTESFYNTVFHFHPERLHVEETEAIVRARSLLLTTSACDIIIHRKDGTIRTIIHGKDDDKT